MPIEVYYSSVSSSMETKKHQQKIFMVLDSKKIPYEKCDIASDPEKKEKMKEIAGGGGPPQIVNEVLCGDYNAFDEAVECETLNEFLRI